MYEQKPWLKFYGNVPETIDYPRVTMYEALKQTARDNPESVAYDFMGYTSTYSKFMSAIDQCADALASLGLKKDDRITISMPTSPQGIICFYAVNKLGAVASMLHPLSTAKEIEVYLNQRQTHPQGACRPDGALVGGFDEGKIYRSAAGTNGYG